MFSGIRRTSPFYNKSIMDYSLKCTNDYVKRMIEKNEKKKNQFKIDLKVNEIIQENETSVKKDLNILDENSSEETKIINYIPICIFLSISSFLCFYSLKK